MNQIQLAAKLYECRDTAKKFFKEEYSEKLKPYTHILMQVMKRNQLEEIPALLRISKTEMYQENVMAQMMFIAAVVELIEPYDPSCPICNGAGEYATGGSFGGASITNKCSCKSINHPKN